jgi:hypothetical protein
MAVVAERLAGVVSITTQKEKNMGERRALGERGGSAGREREREGQGGGRIRTNRSR